MTKLAAILVLCLYSVFYTINAQSDVELMWEWVTGGNATGGAGTYGARRNPSTEAMPGSRVGAAGWYDSTNKILWMFGGQGIANDTKTAGTIQCLAPPKYVLTSVHLSTRIFKRFMDV